MKRPIKILLVTAITAISVVVLLFVGGFIYYYFSMKRAMSSWFEPRPIHYVQPEAWAQGEFPLMKYVEAKKGDLLVGSSMSWGGLRRRTGEDQGLSKRPLRQGQVVRRADGAHDR